MEKQFVFDPELDYFTCGGTDLIAFSNHIPSQHQSGLILIMNNLRVATCGDVRFEPTPGQFQPASVLLDRQVDAEAGSVRAALRFPDEKTHLKGFNPLIYPDFCFEYTVEVTAIGNAFRISVHLSEPIPERYAGRLCFNLEFCPAHLFGKPWMMDNQTGIFPRQPNGPVVVRESRVKHRLPDPEGMHADAEQLTHHYGESYSPAVGDDIIALPYAVGHRFTCRPDDSATRFTVTSDAELKLYDGRMNHNSGWFVLSSPIPSGCTDQALTWTLIPEIDPDYLYTPVVQVSQIGYLPAQSKKAFIELDRRAVCFEQVILEKLTEKGFVPVRILPLSDPKRFMRYQYLTFDFSDISESGMYRVCYGSSVSAVFRIASDVFDRGVWQPVLEYFLPVQMCHMRVNEKYRVWHGLCHMDDARMAPVNYNHFDGYSQGPSTLTKYQSGDHVPGLNAGGWHDAGDYDLRVESQAGDCYILTLAYEEFCVDYDVTTIDQSTHTVEIHQPDGKNDILQQIEHGLLTVVGGYRALGRLYRGIICNDLRQYVLLGDAVNMTANIPGDEDDRWVFTEDNPRRELLVAAQLAASSRAMKGFNEDLCAGALEAAEELFAVTDQTVAPVQAFHAAAELYLTTGKALYRDWLLDHTGLIVRKPLELCWIACRVHRSLKDSGFTSALRSAVAAFMPEIEAMLAVSPYGVFYRRRAWGITWDVQAFAFRYYYILREFPDLCPVLPMTDALSYILGCHAGSNTASTASGIGSRSAIPAYSANRADWSYIPGGVCSGPEQIAPDFPEFLEFPFLWEQLEYVLDGGSSHFLFLTLAVKKLLG